eukprot:g8704.t1
MEQLTEMVDFEISFNRLEEFMVDVLKWGKLNSLLLHYNDITRYNEKALWRHRNVVAIDLLGNKLERLQIAASYLPSLNYLHIGENAIIIDVPFHKKQFPSLMFLYLNGNRQFHFPDKSLKDGLLELGIARCNLKSLPLFLSTFNGLKYLDVRDNNITVVDNKLKALIQNNQAESYFAGNPVCQTDKSLDCEPLCSKHCYSRTATGNGICDSTCDTNVCEFDGGDCK